MVPTAQAVAELLAATRLPMEVETVAQSLVEAVLVGRFGQAQVSREYRLGPGDRPDFLVGGEIVVEMKGPRHRAPAVLRQLKRYADHPQVTAIVLLTARAMLMPRAIEGAFRTVPLIVINMARAWL